MNKTMYRVHFDFKEIKEVQVYKETEQCIYILGSTSRHKKTSTRVCFYDDYSEAYAALKKYYDERLAAIKKTKLMIEESLLEIEECYSDGLS